MLQLFVISRVLSGKCQVHVICGTQQMCGGDNHSLQTKHPISSHEGVRLVVMYSQRLSPAAIQY